MTRPIMIAVVLFLAFVAGPAHGHDWYPQECCSGQDCRPVPQGEARQSTDGGLAVLINGVWTAIPPEKIRSEASPDGRLHVCYSRPPAGTPKIYCVFVPGSI